MLQGTWEYHRSMDGDTATGHYVLVMDEKNRDKIGVKSSWGHGQLLLILRSCLLQKIDLPGSPT